MYEKNSLEEVEGRDYKEIILAVWRAISTFLSSHVVGNCVWKG